MKNILQIGPDIKVKGGISSVLNMYLNTKLTQEYRLTFISSHEDGSKAHKFIVMIKALIKLFILLKTKRIDIVHIHCGDIPSPYRKYFFYKLCRYFKKIVIFHFHGALFLDQFRGSSNFWKKRLRTLFEDSDSVICLSKKWSEDITSLFPGSKIQIIPNGVFLPNLPVKSINFQSSPVKLLFLGLIGSRKGIYDLLASFEHLLREGYDAYLYIGGNGDILELKHRISSPILKDRVKYLGWIANKEKDRLFRTCDIFVLPSYGEGMPISILEAISYGLPVISTPVGGIPEIIDDCQTGFLVNPGDTQNLYDKLKVLIENRDLRVKMGLSGRRKAENTFDINNNYKAISQLYKQLSDISYQCKPI